ncbi:hypothetical protein NC77_26615 [Janthinobacterium lividum]|nr:hypothetical protein NC77_26615 [Janthinobacterium lividum]
MTIEQKIQNIFGWEPIVPHDEAELRHIHHLMDKVPLYLEKLDELIDKVNEFSKVAQPLTINAHMVIDRMILHAFFSDLENRNFSEVDDEAIGSFASRVRANLKLEGVINARNLGCEVCGENRSTDKCHIVPNKLGGSAEPNNILVLCPTHHRLFDRFMLSRAEYAAIDWERKSIPSQHYAHNATLMAHTKYWEKIEAGSFCRVPQFDREAIPFVRYVIVEILGLFKSKSTLKRDSLYTALDPNLHGIARKIVTHLVKNKVLLQKDIEGKSGYLSLMQYDVSSLDEIAFRTWQAIC